MKKEWVLKKQEENAGKADELFEAFKNEMNQSGLFTDSEIHDVCTRMNEWDKMFPIYFLTVLLSCIEQRSKSMDKDQFGTWFDSAFKFSRDIEDIVGRISHCRSMDFSRYLDSEPVHFDGDIIITDPCYIIKRDQNDDWSRCVYGYNMENIGINHYMTRDTIYGDWSCTTFNSDTEKPIGEFCADAGLVSVFLLDEIIKYNPSYNDPVERPHMATLIKDFCGTVQFVVTEESYILDEDCGQIKKGDVMYDYCVEVIGHGINKVTGEPINFIGTQTGM